MLSCVPFVPTPKVGGVITAVAAVHLTIAPRITAVLAAGTV